MVDPKTVKNMRTLTCSICDIEYTGWGNNAWPINEGRCCDDCNGNHVLLARIARMRKLDTLGDQSDLEVFNNDD